jgi:hypothetical protein
MHVKKTPIKDFSFNLILLLLSVMVGLSTCEIIIRIFKLTPEVYSLNPGFEKSVYKISSNPILGYEFKENYRDNKMPNLMNSYPYINSHGHRDIERAYEKSKGVKRIILLGDSVACGAKYIDDIKDTIPGQLEYMLKEKRTEVLNFGINGYCTLSEIELLKMQGIKYKPDLVILLFVDNDYDNANNDLGMVSLDRPKIVESLFVSSYLFRFLCLRFNLFHMREQFGLNNLARYWIGTLDQSILEKAKQSNDVSDMTLKNHLNAIGENNVENGLRLLKELSVEYNFRILIGIWPTFEQNRIVDYETHDKTGGKYIVPDTQKLYIEQLADRYRIPCFRFSRFFAYSFDVINKNGTGKYFSDRIFTGDTMHATKIGATIAANALKEIIESDPVLLGNGR